MTLSYRIIGNGPIEIVVEMGLGACIEEWLPPADKLKQEGSILLYERAGIHRSKAPTQTRTPKNIAMELADLLKQLKHAEKLIIIAHSQGGLYAQQFVRLYPDMVKGLILLDPLSANDRFFKEQLNGKEYKKAGVDKSQNFVLMRKLAKMKLGGLTKMMLKSAPPFYYYHEYSDIEKNEILSCADNIMFIETCLQEYIKSHEMENIQGLIDKGNFPDIPLILITHTSELAIKENMEFGRNTREFAMKIENMWQQIMKEYLTLSKKSEWIQANHSTHYIHLQEPEIVITAIKRVKQYEL